MIPLALFLRLSLSLSFPMLFENAPLLESRTKRKVLRLVVRYRSDRYFQFEDRTLDSTAEAYRVWGIREIESPISVMRRIEDIDLRKIDKKFLSKSNVHS